MLTKEETINLIKLAQNGDLEAKNTLLIENSPLIKSVIKKFLHKNIEYDDLFQLGSIGFLKAINNFKEEFNVQFSTYVVPMIIGEIKRFLRDDGEIKVSRSIKAQNMEINKFIYEFQRKHLEKPSIKEIATKFQISEEEVIFITDSGRMPISIYTPLEDEESGMFLIDRFVENNEEENLINKLTLISALNSLNPRDKKIVLLRFFRDKTQSEIARELNISQVQVSRLENKILKTLKDKLDAG